MESNQNSSLEEIKALKHQYLHELDEIMNDMNSYNYNNDNWNSIRQHYDVTRSRLESTSFAMKEYLIASADESIRDFRLFINSVETLSSSNLNSKEIFYRKLRVNSNKFGTGTKKIWSSIKFLFAIPGITFSSFVIMIVLDMIFATILYWLFPKAYEGQYEGVVESFLAAIIYITLKCMIIKDIYENKPGVDLISYTLKHLLAIAIWWIPFLFIRYKQISCPRDLAYFLWIPYIPYLWISAFTGEYFISCIIAYLVVQLLPFILVILYIYISEYRYKNRLKNSNKDKVKDDSYDFHYTPTDKKLSIEEKKQREQEK
ncbi:MAG: hypothetical protein WCR33_03175 [Bacilli bacterium]